MLGSFTPQPPPGIRIGNHQFSSLEAVPSVVTLADRLLDGPGLYAILQPPTLGVAHYGILYVGESQTIRTRATATHENYSSWKRHSSTIYRVFFPMPGSTQTQRQALESALIAQFTPPCNERLSYAFSRLLGR